MALFRYGVIVELLLLPHGSPELRQAKRDKAGHSWTIPGSRRTPVAFETLRDWLVPKPHHDRGRAQRLPPDVVELLIRIKESGPALTIRR